MTANVKPWQRREFLKGAGTACGAWAMSPLLSFLLEDSARGAALPQAALPQIDLPITALPSLNETVSFIIRAGKFDQKNGIIINFKPRPLGPALNDYRSGFTSLNAATTLVQEGDHLNRGLPTRVLFSTFDYYSTILSADPGIRTLKDLEGKRLGANTVSGMYSMFQWFAMKEKVSLDKSNIQSLGMPALVPTLMAGRVDALHCWEPAASIVEQRAPGRFHRIDFSHKWKQYTGFDVLPFLTVAVTKHWADTQRHLIPSLFNAYKDASDFLYSNQQDAVQMMAELIEGKIPTPVLEEMVRKDTFLFYPRNLQEMRKETEAVFRAMVETGRTDQMPGPDLIYEWE